jgi:hypothetical protein
MRVCGRHFSDAAAVAHAGVYFRDFKQLKTDLRRFLGPPAAGERRWSDVPSTSLAAQRCQSPSVWRLATTLKRSTRTTILRFRVVVGREANRHQLDWLPQDACARVAALDGAASPSIEVSRRHQLDDFIRGLL